MLTAGIAVTASFAIVSDFVRSEPNKGADERLIIGDSVAFAAESKEQPIIFPADLDRFERE